MVSRTFHAARCLAAEPSADMETTDRVDERILLPDASVTLIVGASGIVPTTAVGVVGTNSAMASLVLGSTLDPTTLLPLIASLSTMRDALSAPLPLSESGAAGA